MTPLPPGLVAITGDERTGKTTLLRRLCDQAQGLWLDLALPDDDERTPRQVWDAVRARAPQWDEALAVELAQALDLQAHAGKQLFMLSRGSRRKVALVALLAAGAAVTGLDQPYAALDAASIAVLRDFLTEAAQHASRTWIVADYEADPQLPWARQIDLGLGA
jgi:ABC-type transport system involved in cytochrome c biogenesis ATPase subunit